MIAFLIQYVQRQYELISAGDPKAHGRICGVRGELGVDSAECRWNPALFADKGYFVVEFTDRIQYNWGSRKSTNICR
jgi:hypothetical protein